MRVPEVRADMRLTDLEPQFIRREIRREPKLVDDGAGGIKEVVGDVEYHVYVDSITEAEGIMFRCPKCFAAKGPIGTHYVLCWRPRVPPDVDPKPGRWEFEGTGVDDLTLTAGSSSILLTGPGCQAHFFIRSGAIVDC